MSRTRLTSRYLRTIHLDEKGVFVKIGCSYGNVKKCRPKNGISNFFVGETITVIDNLFEPLKICNSIYTEEWKKCF